jgi:outer membrane protein assembly factor BamB
VATEVDAMYFTDDGQRITKIGLEDGKQIWESESVASGGDDLTVTLQDGAVLVGSTGSVAAIDAVTGLTLWRGTAPDRARFVGRQVTQSYVVAVDVGNARDQEVTAFFYDHRNASGVIPADGGAPSLGRLSDVRAVLAVNGGLVVQAGTTIHVYAND